MLLDGLTSLILRCKTWTHNPISEMTRHTGTDRRTTKTYRVFTGAPSAKDVSQPTSDYHWRTVSSKTPAYGFPPATLEAASLRISLLYQNIIFGESDEHPDDAVDDDIPLSGANRTDIRGESILKNVSAQISRVCPRQIKLPPLPGRPPP